MNDGFKFKMAVLFPAIIFHTRCFGGSRTGREQASDAAGLGEIVAAVFDAVVRRRRRRPSHRIRITALNGPLKG